MKTAISFPATALMTAAILFYQQLPAFAQDAVLTLRGTVTDARSNEPLPFANVVVPGTDIGVVTDLDGLFELAVEVLPDSLSASYVGYASLSVAPRAEGLKEFHFALEPISSNLEQVTVTGRRERYRRKGNPALALIRQVIDHKNDNRLETLPYYSYDRYEKVELDVSNLNRQFIESKALNPVDFVFEHLDTLPTGVIILPFFLQESNARVFYRQSPEVLRELQEGLKVTQLDDYVTDESMYKLTRRLYQEIDIYQNAIWLFEQKFVSPLAPIAPTFYHYYISDTTLLKGREVISLAFVPANKYDLGFDGTLYVANDSTYQVLGVDLGILPYTNLNFVKSLKVRQEFELRDSIWVVTQDQIEAEYVLSKRLMGLYGKKTTFYSGYSFEAPPDPTVFDSPGEPVAAKEDLKRNESYWKSTRPQPLTEAEAAIYSMVDSLRAVPMVRKTVSTVRTLSSGYLKTGPVYLGSLYSLASFNDVEGWRFRLGARTNERFHDQIHLRGYLAYGLGDRRMKFGASIRYALEDAYRDFPRHYLSVNVQRENQFPGQFLQFADADNLLLSFRPNVADKMIAFDLYQLGYHKEFPGNLFTTLYLQHRNQSPAGAWDFTVYDEAAGAARQLNRIVTAETGLSLVYAPKAEIYESAHFRYPMPNAAPILELTYLGGWKGVLNGDHTFQTVELGITKRFYLSALGMTDAYFSGGKVFGREIPFVLLHIPNSNQSYAYLPKAYNQMNFMEFVADVYAGLHLTHRFNGFILNKIPLLRRLKWRSIVGFKVLYSRLSDDNNPNLNPSLVQFPATDDGQPATFAMDGGPYVEWSVGLSNILKFFRIDYVKRITYLDHPNIPSAFGLRGAGVKVGLELRF